MREATRSRAEARRREARRARRAGTPTVTRGRGAGAVSSWGPGRVETRVLITFPVPSDLLSQMPTRTVASTRPSARLAVPCLLACDAGPAGLRRLARACSDDVSRGRRAPRARSAIWSGPIHCEPSRASLLSFRPSLQVLTTTHPTALTLTPSQHVHRPPPLDADSLPRYVSPPLPHVAPHPARALPPPFDERSR